MKGTDLYNLYKSGLRPVVEFKEGIQDFECFDPGMRAKLIHMHEEDECYGCTFDFKDFEEYNKVFEVPDYYGKEGNLVPWSQSSFYPKDKKVKIYIDADLEIKVFQIVEESVAYQDYKKSGSKKKYLEWLEEQYARLKNQLNTINNQ